MYYDEHGKYGLQYSTEYWTTAPEDTLGIFIYQEKNFCTGYNGSIMYYGFTEYNSATRHNKRLWEVEVDKLVSNGLNAEMIGLTEFYTLPVSQRSVSKSINKSTYANRIKLIREVTLEEILSMKGNKL